MPTKVRLVKAMIFPVVYGCGSWPINKTEYWRIDAFEPWCWRRFLRVLWTAKRSNQSILKEISPEYSLERLMLKLKLNTLATWCQELTHLKKPWCWERLKAEGDDRGWDGWMASPSQWAWIWACSGRWWKTGKPVCLFLQHSQSKAIKGNILNLKSLVSNTINIVKSLFPHLRWAIIHLINQITWSLWSYHAFQSQTRMMPCNCLV